MSLTVILLNGQTNLTTTYAMTELAKGSFSAEDRDQLTEGLKAR
ncbi:hypothetical protein [Cohnella endophytica]|nr:hypothetical protein [Cohnella endophytica]